MRRSAFAAMCARVVSIDFGRCGSVWSSAPSVIASSIVFAAVASVAAPSGLDGDAATSGASSTVAGGGRKVAGDCRPVSFGDFRADDMGDSFAGDWLHTTYPSALMERAVSTGREAANHILLADGVCQAPMTVTASRGPGFI